LFPTQKFLLERKGIITFKRKGSSRYFGKFLDTSKNQSFI